MILSFKNFLNLCEAKRLESGGKKGTEHKERYFTSGSYVGEDESLKNLKQKESRFELHAPVGEIPAGSKLHPIEGSTRREGKKWKSDFHVIDKETGKTTILKGLNHRQVGVQSEKSGKHSDEAAVVSMWNNMSTHALAKSGTRVPTVKEMHDEIEKAKNDEDHPLHISKANKSEFVHGLNGIGDNATKETRERAEKSYYQNLKDAAHTISRLAEHEDFKQHWVNRDIFESSGRIKTGVSKFYQEQGVKPQSGVSKSDVITVKSRDKGHKALKLISLKQGAGSQLMSSSPEEFAGIYKHALRQHFGKMKMSEKARQDNISTYDQHIDSIKSDLLKGNHISAHKKIQRLHVALGGGKVVGGKAVLKDSKFNREVHEEAITGKGKFPTKLGTATHIVTIGEKAKVQKVSDYLDEHEKNGNLLTNVARATKGKHGEKEGEEGEKVESTAVRLDAPKTIRQKKTK